MQIRKHQLVLALALALAMVVAVPVFAQQNNQQSGLVNVSLQNVANNIAQHINVSNIPVSVQVPVGVAATVCNIDANVLARQAQQGQASCTAQQTSTALEQIVQRQVNQQGQTAQPAKPH